MRINDKKRLSPLAIAVIALATILLGTGAVFAYQKLSNTNTAPSGTSPSIDKPNPSTPTTIPDSKGGEQFSGPEANGEDEAPQSTSTSMQITSLNQTSDTLQIRTLIQDVWASGSCELRMTKEGVDILRKAAIQALPSSSTCQGFDIPLDELSRGEWSVTINASNGGESASANSKVVVQ
jgi:hypothetical protein